MRAHGDAVLAHSRQLTAANRRLLACVRATQPADDRATHFAYLRAELGDQPVLALVRRDGSAAGHRQWLRRAERLIPFTGAGNHPVPDPILTVLSLTRSCDRLDALDLLDAGDRGLYPPGAAMASEGSSPSPLAIDVDEWGDIHVVRLNGELDLMSESALRDKLCAVRCSTLQVDLSKLRFCDASGLTALMAAKRERELEGCRVAIVGARGIVRRVFEITGYAEELDD